MTHLPQAHSVSQDAPSELLVSFLLKHEGNTKDLMSHEVHLKPLILLIERFHSEHLESAFNVPILVPVIEC